MSSALSVFIADDDPDDLMFFRETLDEIDPSILYSEFPNGEALLIHLRNGSGLPDYIFLDINMPKLNGIECLKILKEDARLNKIPVIMYSTTSNPKDIQHALDLGADSFLKKPDSIEKLHEALNTILNSH